MELLEAARHGDIDRVEAIINGKHSCDIDGISSDQMTPLMMAAMNGHKRVVEMIIFLGHDIDVNQVDRWGWSALHWAAVAGHDEVVDTFLANRYVDVNMKVNKDGVTALHRVALLGNLGVLNAFLNHRDLDINLQDSFGRTALMWAMYGQRADDSIRILLGNDLIRTDLVDNDGRRAFDYATRAGNRAAVAALRDLSLYNVVNDNSDDERSLLMAARIGDINLVRDVISVSPRVNINAVNCNGWTPLMISSYRNYIDIIELLLSREELMINYGIDRYGHRLSALTLAIEADRCDVVYLLINNNCHHINLEAVDPTGRTALMIARDLHHDEIVNILSDSIAATNVETALNASMPSIDSNDLQHNVAKFLLVNQHRPMKRQRRH